MSAEEFKILTEVDLDTKSAEGKMNTFIKSYNNKGIPVKVELDNVKISNKLNDSIKNIGNKLNDSLDINESTLAKLGKLDTILKNVKKSLDGLDNKNINIFNVDGSNTKLLDDNIKSIENYVKKVENGFKRIEDAKDNIKNKGKEIDTNVNVDIDEAINDIDFFINKIDKLRFQFSHLNFKVAGIDNIDKVNNQLDNLIDKARKNVEDGIRINTPDVDRDNKVLIEKLKLFKKLQAEYSKFEKMKIDLGNFIDEDSINHIETLFRNMAKRITNMDDLEVDFNIEGFVDFLNKIKRGLKDDIQLDVGLGKAEEDFLKFFNKLELLKFELKELSGLDINIIGKDNFEKIENEIDKIKSKAGEYLSNGKSLNNSDIQSDLNNLKEQEKLLKRVQKEYANFSKKKNSLVDIIGNDKVRSIENTFKDAFSKIASMQNLDLDFNLKKLFNDLKEIDNVYEIKIETEKAEKDLIKFQSKIDDVYSEIEKQTKGKLNQKDSLILSNYANDIQNKAKNILYGKEEGKISDLLPDINNVKKRLDLIKKVNSEYDKFNSKKNKFSEFIKDNEFKNIDKVFKDTLHKLVNAKNPYTDTVSIMDKFEKNIKDISNKYDDRKIKYKLEIDEEKALAELEKFETKLNSKKFNFKKMNIDLLGSENLKKVEGRIDKIKNKALDNISSGFKINTPSVDKDLKILEEQERLLKRVLSEYDKFISKKPKFSEIVDKDSLQFVENEFREMLKIISSMEGFELDFNLEGNLKHLKNLIDGFGLNINITEAEKNLAKLESSLDALKFKFKSLNLNMIDENSIRMVEDKIEDIRKRIRENAEKGLNANDSGVSKEILNLKEQEKLLRRVQQEYNRFINRKNELGEIIDESKVENIANKFKAIIQKILSMEKLNVDFNVEGSINELKNDIRQLNPHIDTDGASNQLGKLENKLDALKYKFKSFDINIVGIDNIEKIERKIESIKAKAKENAQSGLKIESPEVDKQIKNLREQEKLMRKIQTQYNNFNAQKVDFEGIIDADSIRKVDDAFKDIFHRIASMENLEIDLNVDGLLNNLKNINKQIRDTKTGFSGMQKFIGDFKSEIAHYTAGEILGEMTIDFAKNVGRAYIELDRSMREIKKVAEPQDIDSVDKLKNIRKEAIGIAKDVGMASSDVQNSIASALQAGIGGMKESIEVAKQSMILANVGDMTQDSASKAINTVVKSFQLSPLKSYQLEVDGTIKKTTELKNAMDMMNFAG